MSYAGVLMLCLVGAAGFEPACTGTKNRGLTAWRRSNRLVLRRATIGAALAPVSDRCPRVHASSGESHVHSSMPAQVSILA